MGRGSRGAFLGLLLALLAACAAPSGSLAPSVPPTGSATSPATGSPPPSSGPSASLTPVPSSPLDALTSIPTAEGVLNAVWLGDDRVVVAGFHGPAFTPAILVFRDGTWIQATIPQATGQVAAIAPFGGRLYAVGNGLPDARTGFIWVSDDGLAWQEVHTVTDGALYDIDASGDVVVAVGAHLTDEMVATAAVWTSTDGATWAEARVGGSERTPMGSVAVTGRGFAASGDRPLGEPRPFWTAEDPATWTPVANDLDRDYLPIDLQAAGDQVVLVGASGRSGDQHPFIATTTDGAAWEQRLLGSDAEGYASAVTEVRGTVLVAGVYEDALLLFTPLEDAVAAEPIEAMGASIGALRWSEDWGLIGVGSKDRMHAVWVLPS